MKQKMRGIARILACLFCAICASMLGACTQEISKEIQVYAPDGAPALSIAKLLQEDTQGDGVTYTVVKATTIDVYVTGETPKADVCILPLNTASKFLGDGNTYALCGIVTHGNLYMLSTQSTVYTTENLSFLIGKTVGVVQLANVPGLTFKIILNKLGLPWAELKNDQTPSPDVINVKAVSADAVSPATQGIDVFVAPEPAASVKAEKTSLEFVGDLQALYNEQKGYPQAALVIKKSLIQDNPAWVEGFLKEVEENAKTLSARTQVSEIQAICNAVQSHLTQGLSPTLTAQSLTSNAINNSGVRFEAALAYKVQITEFLQQMISVQDGAASLIEDKFYYGS